MYDRRSLLRTVGLTATSVGIAGCTRSSPSGSTTTNGTTEETADDDASTEAAANAAVAAEWNAMRARLFDAHAAGVAGKGDVGAQVAADVFARFEAAGGEWGAHERLEHVSHDHYEGFEGDLESLREALESGDVSAARSAADGASAHLAEAQEAVVPTETGQALELLVLGASAETAAVLAAAGHFAAASSTAAHALETFEAASVHEAIEEASPQAYESFEAGLAAVSDAADGEDATGVNSAASATLEAAVRGAYELGDESAVGAGHLAAMQAQGFDAAFLARLDGAADAASVVRDVFASFEDAAVHELLEEADRDAYESFEGAMESLIDALAEDGDVAAAVDAFATATLRAQFAVVGASDDAPIGDSDAGEHDSTDPSLSGGPDVVDGDPADADHVVKMHAASFAPEELTVSVGDTVAFVHAGGEAHTVTASGSETPTDATYWASGGFDSEAAAEEGWEDGAGAVQAGQAYVHTFETAGTHRYYCIPHEAAGMAATVVVE